MVGSGEVSGSSNNSGSSNSSNDSQMTGHDHMSHSVTQGGSVETAAQMQRRSPQAYYRMMADMAMSTRQLPLAGIGSVLVGLILVALIAQVAWPSRPVAPDLDGPARVGDLLLSGYMMAFEGAAFLILTGILGAVLLARREPANRRSRKKKPRAKVGNGSETATPNDNSRSESESAMPNLNSISLRSTEGR